jgi:GT2 family glycosyltransferase
MDQELRVSAIIVNWNGATHLRVCLPSLLAQSFRSLEIIVVDNHSSDESKEVARSFGVRWLPLDVNLGLAPALNRGAAVASGDLLLFVNNDMRFDSTFVAKLVEPLESDDEVFATDGMQFNWDGSTREHMATALTNVSPKGKSSVELVPGLYFYQKEVAKRSRTFMASAACMMVRRRIFEKLGGFEDRLPLGYEDVELCWRAWMQRHTTFYVPDALCWHRIGSSVGSMKGARFAFRGVLKGRLLFATKLLPTRYAVRTWLVSSAGLAKDLARLRWRFAIDRIGVLLYMVGLVPRLLRERKEQFRNARISPEEQLNFLLQLTGDDSDIS